MIRRYLFYSRSDKQQNSFQHTAIVKHRQERRTTLNCVVIWWIWIIIRSALDYISYDHCRCPDWRGLGCNVFGKRSNFECEWWLILLHRGKVKGNQLFPIEWWNARVITGDIYGPETALRYKMHQLCEITFHFFGLLGFEYTSFFALWDQFRDKVLAGCCVLFCSVWCYFVVKHGIERGSICVVIGRLIN